MTVAGASGFLYKKAMFRILLLLCVSALTSCGRGATITPAPAGACRWLYLQTGLASDDHFKTTLALLERVAGEGYNGVVFADFKFMRWDSIPEFYPARWRAMR